MVELSHQKLNATASFQELGYELLTGVASEEFCDALANELSLRYEQEQKRSTPKIGGIRNLLTTFQAVANLASSSELRALVESRLGKAAFPVRAIFFDKTPEANWQVQWHQDLSIAVAEQIETTGFSAWSLKDGVLHVHPPVHILESMVTLRLHLDDCRRDNGALKVIPGSHLEGKLAATKIPDYIKNKSAFVCESPKGTALIMRPLLLHASLAAETPSHRRVLHLEYAADQLPNGLRWFYQ